MSSNKLFIENGKEILQDGECWAMANSPYQAEVIAEALNMLIRENELLKSENKEMSKRIDLICGCLNDEGSITLEKYNEIVDYLYREWKSRRC